MKKKDKVYERGFAQLKFYMKKYSINRGIYEAYKLENEECLFGVVANYRKGACFIVAENFSKYKFEKSLIYKGNVHSMAPVFIMINNEGGMKITKVIPIQERDMKLKKEFHGNYSLFGKSKPSRVSLRG